MTQGKHPNVVVIVIDTLRYDHLSVNGYFRDTAPRIEAIADRGVTFDNYFGSATATGPAFTSLITGLRPISNNYYDTPWNRANGPQLDDDIPTMAEIFQANGYQTVAVDNLVNFRSHMKQFVRGYEAHLNPTGSPDWIHHHVTADAVNDQVLPWIDHHADEPFFLFIHYWDPHTPYNQPESFRDLWRHEPGSFGQHEVREAEAGYSYVPGWGEVTEMVEGTDGDSNRSIDQYDAEIRYVDDRIGQVYDQLAEAGYLDDCIVSILGDHGEQLGQHGLWGHRGLHDAVTHVPFILQAPGLPNGIRSAAVSHHADLLPTLLDLADITTIPSFEGHAAPATTEEMDGSSVVGRLDETDPNFELVLETSSQRGIRTQEWKYIRDAETDAEELYHLGEDPMERLNLADEQPDRTRQFRERLLEWVDVRTDGLDPLKRRIAERNREVTSDS